VPEEADSRDPTVVNPHSLENLHIISLGGNAIIRRGDKGTIEEQFANTRACTRQVSRMIKEGYKVIITHGNGPVVGNIVLRGEAAKNTIPPMPLYICDADSEGGIGFMIQQTLYNHLRSIHQVKDVVTIITQVVVAEDDPAFKEPTKPIGPHYLQEEAEALRRTQGWRLVEDSGRGFRRVVPSPRPVRIVEKNTIKHLALEGVVVIAVGGGGIPVVESPKGDLKGVDAVIDKDLSTSVLAREVGARSIISLTEVDMVYLDYGTEDQRGLREVSLEEMRAYYGQGHFPPGSMGPKIEAAIEFLEAGGEEVIITLPELVEEALEGKAGTRIRP
jgi:carbamate kinase